jgi:hypothetical protein
MKRTENVSGIVLKKCGFEREEWQIERRNVVGNGARILGRTETKSGEKTERELWQEMVPL